MVFDPDFGDADRNDGGSVPACVSDATSTSYRHQRHPTADRLYYL